MSILVITVDLQCCRCKKKIKNVLECLKGKTSAHSYTGNGIFETRKLFQNYYL
uniref:HMA domain-containing protein n=1 Tax=Aegilops tauschii subsp. strangulata TaxID=200361 RepID=A0A453BWA6_AEGTS